MRPPSQKVFAVHPWNEAAMPLPDRLVELYEDQKKTWKRFAEASAALGDAKTRPLACNGQSVTLQFNPQRITSASARLDEQTVRSRACFLCIENLPKEQQGVLFQDDFLILCNPAPIFDRHFTIIHLRHLEQAIEPFVGAFLDLAREMSPGFTLFYNGPKCGASAPDHVHFQAGPANVLPVEQRASRHQERVFVRNDGEVSIWTMDHCESESIVMESGSREQMVQTFRRVVGTMRTVLRISEEPMLNLVCTYGAGLWRLILFPRRKHRPDVYYKEGNERILISPGAVDLAGFVVTPIEKDFRSVDGRTIRNIFREVSLEPSVVAEILRTMEKGD